jgi:uncharacterized protein with HEPN domain
MQSMVRTLGHLQAAVDGSREQFEREPWRKWSATLLLICVGNAAKAYEAMTPSATGSFTGIIRMRDRLAHQVLEDIDMSVVWRTARINGPQLLGRARRLLMQ